VTCEVFNSHLEDPIAAIKFSVTATLMRRDIWKSRTEYFTKRVSWVDWDFRAVRILIVRSMFFASIYIEAATGNTDCKSRRQGKLRSNVTESWSQHLTHFDAAVQLEGVRPALIHVLAKI